MTEQQIEELNAIASECHNRDSGTRDRLSVSDYSDWAPELDAADLPDLANRVRAVFAND